MTIKPLIITLIVIRLIYTFASSRLADGGSVLSRSYSHLTFQHPPKVDKLRSWAPETSNNGLGNSLSAIIIIIPGPLTPLGGRAVYTRNTIMKESGPSTAEEREKLVKCRQPVRKHTHTLHQNL